MAYEVSFEPNDKRKINLCVFYFVTCVTFKHVSRLQKYRKIFGLILQETCKVLAVDEISTADRPKSIRFAPVCTMLQSRL